MNYFNYTKMNDNCILVLKEVSLTLMGVFESYLPLGTTFSSVLLKDSTFITKMISAVMQEDY